MIEVYTNPVLSQKVVSGSSGIIFVFKVVKSKKCLLGERRGPTNETQVTGLKVSIFPFDGMNSSRSH